ncbi:hypothetical protein NL676_036479 [Syzygium grande]|nr:hypothetical protein NL676_036479 [Syzygium grande]
MMHLGLAQGTMDSISIGKGGSQLASPQWVGSVGAALYLSELDRVAKKRAGPSLRKTQSVDPEFVEFSLVLGAPQVPCYFIFGDLLADDGNNNNLRTLTKWNYPPYGIDFPGGATRRFTNERTSVDIIGPFSYLFILVSS